MFFVLDENIPPKLAELIKVIFSENSNDQVHSITDLGLRGVTDVELFKQIKILANGEKCIFISGDRNIRKRPPEIQSFKNNNMIAFFCPPSICVKSLQERALYVVNAWKGICEVASKSNEKDVYLLPFKNFSLTPTEIRRYKK